MEQRRLVARLRITPSWGVDPPGYTLTLVGRGDDYELRVLACRAVSGQKSRRRLALDSAEVRSRLQSLATAMVPAFPISPPVCDGRQLELTVYGEGASVTLRWWTEAPKGARRFAQFAEWLEETALEAECAPGEACIP